MFQKACGALTQSAKSIIAIASPSPRALPGSRSAGWKYCLASIVRVALRCTVRVGRRQLGKGPVLGLLGGRPFHAASPVGFFSTPGCLGRLLATQPFLVIAWVASLQPPVLLSATSSGGILLEGSQPAISSAFVRARLAASIPPRSKDRRLVSGRPEEVRIPGGILSVLRSEVSSLHKSRSICMWLVVCPCLRGALLLH